MNRRSRRLAAALPGAALVIATSSLLPGTPARAEPSSPLSLTAPPKVVAWSYGGDTYTDFGLRLVANGAPFEIRANRHPHPESENPYDSPITATWVSPSGDVELPEGFMTSFTGISDFVTIDVTSLRTGKSRSVALNGCLNGDAQRVRPSAPARSPYPSGCPWNPFTLGSVMGVQEGYATSLMSEWESPVRLAPGRYDVTAAIAPEHAELFGISETDATRSLRLVVKEEGHEGRRAVAARAAAGDEEQLAEPNAAPPSGEAPSVESEYLPDLRALPAWSAGLNRKGTALRFAANVWNAGNSPLVIDGFREGDHMVTYQYFFDENGDQVAWTEEPVGEMHWHAENHDHWHFEDFARYRLLQREGDEPTGAVVAEVRSTKQSFCLANTDAVDYTVPGADWQPSNTDLSTACDGRNAMSLRQVLSAGSGDTYFQYRYGQAFRLGGVEDGIYFISVEANPLGKLLERDLTNNTSQRQVKIWTNRRGERRVRMAPAGSMIDEQVWFRPTR